MRRGRKEKVEKPKIQYVRVGGPLKAVFVKTKERGPKQRNNDGKENNVQSSPGAEG